MSSNKTAKPEKIEIKVSSVELTGQYALGEDEVTKLCLNIDMPGDDTPARSATQTAKAGAAPFKPLFLKMYDLRAEKQLRKDLIEALRTATEDDSEMLVHVVDLSGKKEKTIGSASFRLEQALAMKQDHNGPLQIKDSKGNIIGKIVCTISCLAALQELQEDIKAEAAKVWAEGTKEEGQLIVSVKSFRLAGSSKSRPAAAQLKINALGLSSTERVSEPVSARSDGCAPVVGGGGSAEVRRSSVGLGSVCACSSEGGTDHAAAPEPGTRRLSGRGKWLGAL